MHERDLENMKPAFDLHALPVFVPDARLWPRIVAAQSRRSRMRRWSIAASGALAAAIVGTVALSGGLPGFASRSQALLDGPQESQRLEAQWHELASADPPGAGALTRLRSIDSALQAAYDRGAQAEEVSPLWRQRNQALRGLITQIRVAGAQGANTVTRI
jgi:hypothetical protein